MSVSQFIPPMQLQILRDTNNEEHSYFTAVIESLTNTINKMPATYDSEEQDNPVVHLHYFTGICDCWITEKDCEEEQLQAFGIVDIGNGREYGYINIQELVYSGLVELNLHWIACKVSELRK